MPNSRHVAWLHRSTVYHDHTTADDRNGEGLVAPCGVRLTRYRYWSCMIDTEHWARDTLGLRPCRRCFPPDGV
jgi:hypothetical protein